jgi:hypothetical protein
LCPDCFKNSRQIGRDYRDLPPVADRVPRLSESIKNSWTAPGRFKLRDRGIPDK